VTLFFDTVGDADQSRRAEALSAVRVVAEGVARDEQSSSARRVMVRRVCTPLVNEYRIGDAVVPRMTPSPREAEV
jgi:hypothetical protein